MTDIVAEKLKQLPESPGVYLMKDATGKLIYVGKAIILKNRVRQYFQSNRNHSPKVRAMVSHIADFEFIITGTEMEALILECNLIKKHRPRYNISLKDDKSYPYVKVTLAEEYPRIFMTRHIMKDGAKYFGPYTNVTAVHETLKLLKRIFPLRSCRKLGERPCLEYHIKRCLAPCAGLADKQEYHSMIKDVCLFMEGRTEALEKLLAAKMQEAAEGFAFERAARLRDQLQAVRKTAEKQRIVTTSGDQDALGLARSPVGFCVQIFFIRGGKMLGREHFLLKGSDGETDEAMLKAFLEQYYHRATFVPKEVLLPLSLPEEDTSLIGQWLTSRRGSRVNILCPQRGVRLDIVKMANTNAEKFLRDEADRIKLEDEQTLGAVAELGQYLRLKKEPFRMECFDISHNQGSETVASMVVFEGGMPKKSDYRRFKIRSAEGKPDDFKSMREVTTRRYSKLTDAEMPDLIVIDGGMGQLSSALSIIRGLGHKAVPVVGLAKQFELVFVEGSSIPIELPRGSQSLYLIQRIRDEAHRFAITFHRQLRGKRNLVSVLDHIVGIGPKRRQLLWSHFGNLAKIKEATVEEMCQVKGMNRPSAEAVYNFFAAQRELKGHSGAGSDSSAAAPEIPSDLLEGLE